jgi:hypothetical protein
MKRANKTTKIIIKSKNKRKRNNKKRKRNSISNHRYLIKQEYIFNGINYQEQNLVINTIDTLWNIPLFIKYSELYQYLKVANIRLDLTAVQVAGANPPSGYMVFIGNESLDIRYSDIPSLPYAKKIKPVGTTSVLFTRPGRNDDFNRWYNTQSNIELQRMEASIRFRFVEPFTANGAYYMVRISYDIRFDKPFVYTSNSKEKETACIVKASTDSKPILIDKDQEEFDKAWEEDPSDEEKEEEIKEG